MSRVYVGGPEEVPEGFQVQRGERGGYYYETSGGGSQDSDSFIEALPQSDHDLDGLTPEDMRNLISSVPNEHPNWTNFEDGVPSKGDLANFNDAEGNSRMGFTVTARPEDDGKFTWVFYTPEGLERVSEDDVFSFFDSRKKPQAEESPSEPSAEPVDMQISPIPDMDEIKSQVDTMMESFGEQEGDGIHSIENEAILNGVKPDEVADYINAGNDWKNFYMGTNDPAQAEKFLTTALVARDRGWLEGIKQIKIQDGQLTKAPGAYGMFDPGNRDIFGQPIGDSVASPKVDVSGEMLSKGWEGMKDYYPFDTESVDFQEFIMTHELGHHNHYNRLRNEREMSIEEIESDEFLDEMRSKLRTQGDLITEKYSALNANDPFEFVADVFATLAIGKEVPEELLGISEELGGATP